MASPGEAAVGDPCAALQAAGVTSAQAMAACEARPWWANGEVGAAQDGLSGFSPFSLLASPASGPPVLVDQAPAGDVLSSVVVAIVGAAAVASVLRKLGGG